MDELKRFQRSAVVLSNSILAFWKDVITASLGYVTHADEDVRVTAVVKYKNNKHGNATKTVKTKTQTVFVFGLL